MLARPPHTLRHCSRSTCVFRQLDVDRFLHAQVHQRQCEAPSSLRRRMVLSQRRHLECPADTQQSDRTDEALPSELSRARQIRRSGIILSGLMLLGGGGVAALNGLVHLPPAPILWAAAAVAALVPAALVAMKAVLGDSLHVEWHDGKLQVEYAFVDPAAEPATFEVRPTTDGRGNGAFASAPTARGAYVGQYEGDMLSEAQYWRRFPTGVSDYCIRIDNEWTIDGAERAKDSSSFSACHMNHAGGAASNVGRLTIRKQRAVRFYAKRDIQAGEELLLDYGAVYWTRREHLIV